MEETNDSSKLCPRCGWRIKTNYENKNDKLMFFYGVLFGSILTTVLALILR